MERTTTLAAYQSAYISSSCPCQTLGTDARIMVKNYYPTDYCPGDKSIGLLSFNYPVGTTIDKAELILTLTGKHTGGSIGVSICSCDIIGGRRCWQATDIAGDIVWLSLDLADSRGRMSADITSLISANSGKLCLALTASPGTEAILCGVDSTEPPLMTVSYKGGGGGGEDCCPEVMEAAFREGSADLSGEGGFVPAINIADAERVTFFVQNQSSSAVNVNIQISPDGLVFIDDFEPTTLDAGKVQAFVPHRFAKFLRLGVTASGTGSVNAKVWYNIQSRNYLPK